ncbi:ABC transporter substrate-binding protein [Agrobacterium sp. ES01]|uniref:ABC transporter substrate-binding protein n=1 Tax=Agrobacterium sp. ES01 TaxID=3420714 RepID=UPI003D0DA8C6
MANNIIKPKSSLTRRSTLLGMGAAAGAGLVSSAAPGFVRYAQAQTSEPIKLGLELHRTGIGASYGRWYERVANAAVKIINDEGGINGRPVELIVEDDGTDPKRAAEVVEKFATQHKVDLVFGTLFSHVVVGAAPRAGELKMPYLVVSEGTHVSSGSLNRYCFQPGICDVRSQVISMAPWITQNLGKKVTMIFPDYAFGYDHRDNLSSAIKAQGGEMLELIAVPPTETSFTRYLPRIPSDTDVLYHVMVGPAVLTFVTELGQFYGSQRPEIFGFIDSIEAVDLATPQLSFLEGTYFWEGMPRYAQKDQTQWDKIYREAVGVDENGASAADPKDISTYAHMFGVWETLFTIKQAMEMAGYAGPDDKAKFIEALESIEKFDEGRDHPQGDKVFNGKNHQCYGHQNISKVEDSRLNVVHRTSIEDGMYDVTADYTKMSL